MKQLWNVGGEGSHFKKHGSSTLEIHMSAHDYIIVQAASDASADIFSQHHMYSIPVWHISREGNQWKQHNRWLGAHYGHLR